MTWILCLLALLAFGFAVAVVTMIVRQMSKRNGGAATALGVFATTCCLLILGMVALWVNVRIESAPHARQSANFSSHVDVAVSGVRNRDQRLSPMDRVTVPLPPLARTSPLDSEPVTLVPIAELFPVELFSREMGANAGSLRQDVNLNVWANTDLQLFNANAYPDLLAAVKPLARNVREALDANQLLAGRNEDRATASVETDSDAAIQQQAEAAEAENTAPLQLKVTGRLLLDKHRDNVLQRFTEQLRIEFPDGEVSLFDGADKQHGAETVIEDGTVLLTLSLEDERSEKAPWDNKAEQQSGRHRCDIVTSHGSAKATSSYIEKPWVEAFDVFISTRPSRRLIVGYSEKFVSSEEAARRLAMNDARSKSRVAAGGSGAVATADESHVIDRFAQKLSRPYGDVWREAVLLDVSGARMAPAIARAKRQTMHVREHRISVAMSLLILFGVTMVLCMILNLLTQGYYRKRLLMTGGVAAAIVVLLFLGLTV